MNYDDELFLNTNHPGLKALANTTQGQVRNVVEHRILGVGKTQQTTPPCRNTKTNHQPMYRPTTNKKTGA